MKHSVESLPIAVFLLSVMLGGCFLGIDQPGPQIPSAVISNVVWSPDGSTFSFEFDTTYVSNQEYVLKYKSDGTLAAKSSAFMPIAWDHYAIEADTSIVTSSAFGLCAINYVTGAINRLALQSDNILAQSPDHRHFLLRANSNFSPSDAMIARLQLIEVDHGRLQIQKEWFDHVRYGAQGLWLTPGTFGYFRMNADSVQDFVILDTNLKKLDSVATPYVQYHGLFDQPPSIAYGRGNFFFVDDSGVTRVDSVTRAILKIAGAGSYINDVAPDASFVILGEETIVNTRTGVSALLTRIGGWKISPQSDRAACVSTGGESISVSTQSVSAP